MNSGHVRRQGKRCLAALALPRRGASMAGTKNHGRPHEAVHPARHLLTAADIALREAGIAFDLVKSQPAYRQNLRRRGSSPRSTPRVTFPALLLDGGELLTENAALLQYIADLNPAAQLAPPRRHPRALSVDGVAGVHQLGGAQVLLAAVHTRRARGAEAVRARESHEALGLAGGAAGIEAIFSWASSFRSRTPTCSWC